MTGSLEGRFSKTLLIYLQKELVGIGFSFCHHQKRRHIKIVPFISGLGHRVTLSVGSRTERTYRLEHLKSFRLCGSVIRVDHLKRNDP